MHSMFFYSSFNGNIKDWNVSSVADMRSMFAFSSFNSDISGWKIPVDCLLIGMFQQCKIKYEYAPKRITENPTAASKAMVEYRRGFVNEDFLDAHLEDVGKGEIDVRTEVLNEIDDMIFHGFRPSFDVCSLPDSYYHVSSSEDLYKAAKHSCILFGNKCSLNWIDVSGIDDMSNLFKLSEFDGDISRWDVSSVKNMSHMFE